MHIATRVQGNKRRNDNKLQQIELTYKPFSMLYICPCPYTRPTKTGSLVLVLVKQFALALGNRTAIFELLAVHVHVLESP